MHVPTARIGAMILDQLASGERRVLSLVVAVRNASNRTGTVKGDLAAAVKSELRRLVAAGAVVDEDGVYSLARVRR